MSDWSSMFRQYLALREKELWQRAYQMAPPEVQAFLLAAKQQDIQQLNEQKEPLLDILGPESAGGLTIQLAYTDAFAVLVELWRRYPVPQQEQIRSMGMQACSDAVSIAQELSDWACVALYAAVLARGLQDSHHFEQAAPIYGQALVIYRELAENQPGVYPPYVATTLNNLGNVLSEQNRKEEAHKHYQEALALYRELAEKQPGVYRPHVATTLINLGIVLRDLNLKEEAREQYQEALAVYQELDEKRPGVYRPNVATTLNNLGTVLSDQNLKQEARKHFEEALKIYRELAETQPGVHRPDVAMTLNNLGVVLSALNLQQEARDHYEEALQIRRELAEKQPGVYRPYVAMTLNNLGAVLSEQNRKQEAREHYQEALQIRRELAETQPGVYRPDVATTLNNLGNVLSDQNLKQEAREHFQEALAIYAEFRGSTFEYSRVLANWSAVEADMGGTFCARALELAEQAISAVDDLLGPMGEVEHKHRHAFKRYIEPAYERLILYHASALPGSDPDKLPGWLEMLRREDVLLAVQSESAEADPDKTTEMRTVDTWLARQQATLMWTQVALDHLVFVVHRPGRPLQVEIANPDCRNAFRILTKSLYEDFEYKNRAEETQESINDAVSQCMGLLPEGVLELFADQASSTLVLAPCGESSLYPWECLHQDGRYFALEKIFARVHGARELTAVIDRESLSRNALIIGNPEPIEPPASEKSRELPAAGAGALSLAKTLDESGWKVVPSIRFTIKDKHPIYCQVGEVATFDNVKEWLQQEYGLIVFSGHGGVSSLCLEGTDVLTAEELAQIRWRTAPILHLDCCLAGTDHGTGGGKYEGAPVAGLRAGASAVLASAHKLYDVYAADFARTLYRGLLDQSNPLDLGKALLEARNAMHNKLEIRTTGRRRSCGEIPLYNCLLAKNALKNLAVLLFSI